MLSQACIAEINSSGHYKFCIFLELICYTAISLDSFYLIWFYYNFVARFIDLAKMVRTRLFFIDYVFSDFSSVYCSLTLFSLNILTQNQNFKNQTRSGKILGISISDNLFYYT